LKYSELNLFSAKRLTAEFPTINWGPIFEKSYDLTMNLGKILGKSYEVSKIGPLVSCFCEPPATAD